MRLLFRSIFCFCVLQGLCFASVNKVNVTGSVRKKVILLKYDEQKSSSASVVYNIIREKINENLKHTIFCRGMLEDKSDDGNFTSFADYFLEIGVENVNGVFNVKFSLLESKTNMEVLSGSSFVKSSEVIGLINDISDKVVAQISGYKPLFSSKILYISAPYSMAKRHVAIIDRKGDGKRVISKNDWAYTPAYLDGKVFFLNMKKGSPSINFIDLKSLKEYKYNKLNGIKAMSIVPNSDGNLNFVTINDNNSMTGYEMSLKPFLLKSLFEKSNGIVLSINKINDDNYIFEYIKNGTHAIYKATKFLFGYWHTQISPSDEKYLEPKVSPDKKWITFTKKKNGKFYIGIMKLDGSGERILYSGYRAERPSWSPNSMEIVFSYKESKNSLSYLKIVDIYGNEVSSIKSEQNMLEPCWIG